MKYLCFVNRSKDNWNACPDDHCFTFAEGLHQSRRLLSAEPLYPVDTATKVRVRNGQVTMTEGPFAETKELLAGFHMVDAKDLNKAAHIASPISPAKYGSIEVRPVRELAVQTTCGF